MKLFALTILTMFAFAANSVLNRLALLDQEIGPIAFASIRLVSGVLVLMALIAIRNNAVPKLSPPKLMPVLGLTAYMLGFSIAYVQMDAGLGALVLFGVVQVTMFAGSMFEGDRPPLQRWAGMVLAMSGLSVLTLSGGVDGSSLVSISLMAIAGVGWGIYSLIGRKVADPLAATAWSFFYAALIVTLLLLFVLEAVSVTPKGILLAVVSGGLTSGLGYALWYKILPLLGASRAALAQLSVPAIAMFLGVILLGEAVSTVALGAAALIVGGIAIGLLPSRAKT